MTCQIATRSCIVFPDMTRQYFPCDLLLSIGEVLHGTIFGRFSGFTVVGVMKFGFITWYKVQ